MLGADERFRRKKETNLDRWISCFAASDFIFFSFLTVSSSYVSLVFYQAVEFCLN
uniref:Uncharacterized protein n=1 Tax=Rhizophora mucronata TaxID=61149 RepID=A0A2P2PMU2_RHIMU